MAENTMPEWKRNDLERLTKADVVVERIEVELVDAPEPAKKERAVRKPVGEKAVQDA